MSIERIPVSNREEWLKLRQQDVTASVAGALLGVHEYVTPFALWALKSGALGTAEDPEETAAMKRGRLLEPVAVQLLKEQYPKWQIQHGGTYLRDTEARLGATPDLFVQCPERGRGVVQIKSVEQSVFRHKWRDEEGVSPPLWIAVQGILEAYLDGATWAAVAPLVVGFGIDCQLIDIPIHAGVIDKLKARTAEFWQMIERNEAPPADYAKDGEVLAAIYASTADGVIVDLSDDNMLPMICAEDEQLAEQEKTIGKRRKEIKAEIIAKLGAAEGATCQGWSISAKTVVRKSYIVPETSYRSIRKKRLRELEKAS